MEKLNLKFDATRVDEIEQAKGKIPIENCIADNTIGNLTLFLMKGLVSDSGTVGVSRSVAMDTLDRYLAEKDKDELLLDITEALVDGGFLSRTLDVAEMRNLKASREKQLMEEIKNMK